MDRVTSVAFKRRAEVKRARCQARFVKTHRPIAAALLIYYFRRSGTRLAEWVHTSYLGDKVVKVNISETACSHFPQVICDASEIWITLGVTPPIER